MTVLNPLDNNQPLPKAAADYVTKLRSARPGAARDARSGHPGRRAEGKAALAKIGQEIREVYVTGASR